MLGRWLGPLAVLVTVCLVNQAPVTAQEHDPQSPSGEHEETAGEPGEGHHHKNHVAVFVGSTEAEEHHGEKGDPDFTIGFDYERRLNSWFGAGALVDLVVEGKREYLVGPLFILHAGKSAKFFAAPCYQKVHETGHHDFVFRTGFSWDFHLGEKYTIFPAVYYDFAEEQDFLVLGLGFGRGF